MAMNMIQQKEWFGWHVGTNAGWAHLCSTRTSTVSDKRCANNIFLSNMEKITHTKNTCKL